MSGKLYGSQAGLPFSSALRVYEPLEAFPEDQRQQLVASVPAAARGPPSKMPSCSLPSDGSPARAGTPSPPGAPIWSASHGFLPETGTIPTPGGCFTAPASWSSGQDWRPTPHGRYPRTARGPAHPRGPARPAPGSHRPHQRQS
ncbi:hypothetical protein AHiyo1_21850 [Arthrobacter sp. Hiyo1]|nr:hypothetical protein AHiyo1_21850 [Arthrobacter sp. Hiyo1]